jgi:hypothetical protein
MKTIHPDVMKVLAIILTTLASAASLWAQGQVVEGSMEIEIPYFQITPVQVNLSTGTISGENSSGVEMIEASRTGSGYTPPQFSPLPPLPDSQVKFDQAGIQPAPEPSTFALGGLAIGLMALVRLNSRQHFLNINR